MDPRKLFPLGKAYGSAFCNREYETKQLVGHMTSGKHTLIIAPRRYGKSSLAEKAIEQAKLPAIKINFHLCTNEEEVANLLIDTIIKLIGITIGPVEKLIASIKKYLSNIEPSLAFGGDIASLRLQPKPQANYAVIITETLLLIENLLREKNKHAVIFFDEFQEISHINQHGSIEGAIRTAAQEMQNLAIIFSGSIRSLLLSMFEDEKRPLYKLCRKIKLERITAIDYEKHIQKIAKTTWSKYLEQPVFDSIMHFSNRHPYYVNYLCDSIWEACKNLPTLKDVEKAWTQVVAEEWSDALKELSSLSIGQRKILKYIANNHADNLQSHISSTQLSMAPSSISSALNVLITKDYIEKDTHGNFYIINPLLLAVLHGFSF